MAAEGPTWDAEPHEDGSYDLVCSKGALIAEAWPDGPDGEIWFWVMVNGVSGQGADFPAVKEQVEQAAKRDGLWE